MISTQQGVLLTFTSLMFLMIYLIKPLFFRVGSIGACLFLFYLIPYLPWLTWTNTEVRKGITKKWLDSIVGKLDCLWLESILVGRYGLAGIPHSPVQFQRKNEIFPKFFFLFLRWLTFSQVRMCEVWFLKLMKWFHYDYWHLPLAYVGDQYRNANI